MLICSICLTTDKMQIQFEYLADHPECVPLVIDWWRTVWSDRIGSDLARASEQLRSSLSRDELPINILAMLHERPVGTAALKLQEVEDLFPDKQYWLGSVFVDKTYRGVGIASALCMKIVQLAEQKGVPHLYLQTLDLDGGLYGKLGWKPVQLFNVRDEDTLLMIRKLS